MIGNSDVTIDFSVSMVML